MYHLKGLFLLVLGVGWLLIALQGLWRGWLPTGRNGFRQGGGVSRADNPVFFWFMFAVHFCVAAYVTIGAVRFLHGDTTPPFFH